MSKKLFLSLSKGVDSKIDGWMSHVHTWAANFLTLAQHERGIYGAVGELFFFI